MKVDVPPQTLKRYFHALESHIDPVLLPQEVLEAIEQVASPFPDYICNFFGFECLLSDRSQRSDFALNLTARGGELLANLPSARDLVIGYHHAPEWERVSHFLREWGQTNETPFADVNCVWLEFDIGSPMLSRVAPGLILFGYWLDTNEIKSVVRRPLNWLTEKALPILRGETLPPELEQNVLRCIKQASVYTDYFQVGVMLSRKVDAVRLCLFKIKPGQILDYLSTIGWSGAGRQLEKAIADFSSLVDYLCLHIDIGRESIYPRVGLELLYDDLQPWRRQPHREPRWYQLFDRLVERGICTPSKRDALLAWPGFSRFESAATQGVLLRGLQHIKLVCTPDAHLEAKAYFGAGFNPLPVNDLEGEKIKAPREQIVVHTAKSPIERAIDRGIVFLLISRDHQGWWKDFFLPAGASDAWVTGYVGTVLAGNGNPHAQNAAKNAWTLLAQQDSNREGWGYHKEVPADADSTLWGLQLAQVLGRESEVPAQRGHRFLRRHLKPDGGLTTYEQEPAIRKYVQMPPGLVSFDGWFHSHTCVTAAAASLREWQDAVTPYLLSQQQADGSWHSYWWFEDEYCTALAMSVVQEPERLERAVNWGRDRLLHWLEADHPSEFAIAWCLQILSRDDTHATQEAIKRGVEFLLARQRSNGSWSPSAKLRVPRPDCLNPKSIEDWQLWTGNFTGSKNPKNVLENTFNIYSLDNKGIFTTA
ncbi:MAG TPA: prenyltransferase/squalene oxidase repeat-containing protein, partial [Coleofasciculaceae cyanobacterium]